jgi:hypothetical protein
MCRSFGCGRAVTTTHPGFLARTSSECSLTAVSAQSVTRPTSLGLPGARTASRGRAHRSRGCLVSTAAPFAMSWRRFVTNGLVRTTRKCTIAFVAKQWARQCPATRLVSGGSSRQTGRSLPPPAPTPGLLSHRRPMSGERRLGLPVQRAAVRPRPAPPDVPSRCPLSGFRRSRPWSAVSKQPPGYLAPTVSQPVLEGVWWSCLMVGLPGSIGRTEGSIGRSDGHRFCYQAARKRASATASAGGSTSARGDVRSGRADRPSRRRNTQRSPNNGNAQLLEPEALPRGSDAIRLTARAFLVHAE